MVHAEFLFHAHIVLLQRVQAAGNLVKGQQQPTSRSCPYQTLLQQYLANYLPQGGIPAVSLGSQRGLGGSAGQPSKVIILAVRMHMQR